MTGANTSGEWRCFPMLTGIVGAKWLKLELFLENGQEVN
jgi:hypothetical protein